MIMMSLMSPLRPALRSRAAIEPSAEHRARASASLLHFSSKKSFRVRPSSVIRAAKPSASFRNSRVASVAIVYFSMIVE